VLSEVPRKDESKSSFASGIGKYNAENTYQSGSTVRWRQP
jgi:hypothetical protein